MVVRAAESAGLKFAQVKKCRGERSVAAYDISLREKMAERPADAMIWRLRLRMAEAAEKLTVAEQMAAATAIRAANVARQASICDVWGKGEDVFQLWDCRRAKSD